MHASDASQPPSSSRSAPPEHRHTPRLRPLVPRAVYLAHLCRGAGLAGLLILWSLALGAIGYHHFERWGWIDAVHNAAMILTGMGPADHPATTGGKVFATVYALYSGVVFLSTAALVMTPVVRRVIHGLHLDMHEHDGR